ncbi:MAG: diadenylate cyclase CdaA [Verrucomicrobia bacterium]|nr:diadenylate cyclase CdaA [Verrucomicrobiota bacterium]
MLTWLQLNWRTLVEIALLSVGIYYAINFVRGTRAAPVVTGFLTVLLALTLITVALDLQVLRTLLLALFPSLAVIVFVLFQPELRRMLAQLGNLPLFANVAEQRENIEIIIKTVERLSDVRIGMLVAIEQTVSVQEVVESGIVVDCEATPEMLETIFFPNNAIHDGGVILRGDRITHAACIFPLTQRQDLSKTLGTRHRAAIGLSEETDAVVVVVSEESGAVSYAYRGTLVRAVTLENLRAFLTSVLVKEQGTRTWSDLVRALFQRRSPHPPANPRGSTPVPMAWPRIMTVRLGWKILSVLLATLVWVLIRVNSGDGLRFGQVRTFDAVPIHVMTPANDPGVFAVEPPSVRLAVSALPATLKRLRLTDLLVFVNLSSVPEAEAYRDVEVHVPPA